MRMTLLVAVCAFSFASVCQAQTQQTADEREKAETAAGTCEQAKQQHKYWCEERESVSVISFGMECENAKRNVVEACGEPQKTDTSE